MIVLELGLAETSFQAARKIIRSVRGNVGAVKIQRNAIVEVQVFLYGLQVDRSQSANIRRVIDSVFFHHFTSSLNNPAHAGLADEHVMRFLSQHEAASARKRI